MISKAALALMVVVSGASLFLAGIVAPESFRTQAGQAVAQLTAQLVPASQASAKAEDKPAPDAVTAAILAASPATPVEMEAQPAAVKTEPIPIQNLLIPSPLPDQAQYALQVGQFENVDDANTLGATIKNLKLPFDKVLDVIDQSGKQWAIVPIGPYASADEARTARLPVAQALGILTPLPLILLPPPKAKP